MKYIAASICFLAVLAFVAFIYFLNPVFGMELIEGVGTAIVCIFILIIFGIFS